MVNVSINEIPGTFHSNIYFEVICIATTSWVYSSTHYRDMVDLPRYDGVTEILWRFYGGRSELARPWVGLPCVDG